MPVVQATLSFVVELGEFHNVDLYHRGFYQIRTHLKTNGQSNNTVNQSPSKFNNFVEPPILWERYSTRVHVPEAVQASYVDPGQVNPTYVAEKACSKTLRIMYRDESVKLHDVFEQRVLLQIDPNRLEESISKHELFLCVELWFAEEVSDGAFYLQSLEKVHERQLRVQLTPTRSLHYHFNVFFDYFHLCAVEMAIHGALTNISPSIISFPKVSPRTTPLPRSGSTLNLAQQSWHSILFTIRNHASRVQLACTVHRHLCHALLASRESMLMFWREILPYLPIHQRPRIGTVNFAAKLEELTRSMHTLNTDEEMANQLSLDVARLSSQNTVLLKQLCKSTVLQRKVNTYLRRKAHQIRMKRFAEAFFCQELSLVHLLEIYDPNTVGHESLANEVRQSDYFQQLPSLPVTCRELDGDTNSLPIIFEDVFLSPYADDAKRIPWRLQRVPSINERGSATGSLHEDSKAPRIPPRGDSPIRVPSSNGVLANGSSAKSSEVEEAVARRCREKVKRNAPVTLFPDPPQSTKFHPQNELLPPLTVHSRAVSKSSPALADFGLPRTACTLPPVLRYIGQNRRRFRRSSYHGRRSLQIARSKHHLSSVPDPIHDGPVRLLGYRSLHAMADDSPECASKLLSESAASVTRRNPLGTEQPVIRLRQKRISLAARDLRSRSMNSLQTSIASGSIIPEDSTILSYRSDLCSSRAQNSYNIDRTSPIVPQTDTKPRASSAEPLQNVLNNRYSYTSELQSRDSKDKLASERATETRTARDDAVQSTVGPRRSTSPAAILSHSIALGTLSRPPLEPPGGCVPPSHLTNSLDLFSAHDRVTTTDSPMHAFLRSRTLSSLSVPNLVYACSLARVRSESMLNSASSKQAKDCSKYLSNNRGVRRKHSGTRCRRSKSATCHTYTSDLAYLGSYSELDLAILEDTAIQRCVRTQQPVTHMDAYEKSINGRLCNSVSNLFSSDSNEPYLSGSTRGCTSNSYVTCAADQTRNGNNPGRNSRSVPYSGASSTTGSGETIDLIQRSRDCSSNRCTTLPPASHPSTAQAIASLRVSGNAPRSSTEIPNGFHGVKAATVDSPAEIRRVTGDDSPSMPPVHHRLDTRLRECGYQVQSDVDDSDEEVLTSVQNGGRRSEEMMSISELLHEESRNRQRQTLSQCSMSAVNAVISSEAETKVVKHRTLDPSPRPISTSYTRPNSMLASRHSCIALQAQSDLKPLLDIISPGVMEFLQLKENIKRQLAVDFQGHVYSDFATVAAPYAYFSDPPIMNEQVHLVVCVHGLDGNSSDLRLVRVYLQLALPDCRFEFLMSECNQHDTFAGFDAMRDNLVEEVIRFIEELDEPPARISFIAHSMGCVLVRAALRSPLLEPYLSKLHTFLSLSGPHLGTVYNSSGLVNMGMWVMQKWKKSESLSQLRLRDDPDLRNTYMYQLSASAGLDLFRYVLLVSSPQDRYVPYHSTRIELCKAAVRDNSPLGVVYMEMVTNILQRLIKSPRTTVVRYDIHYSLGSSANNLIGRAAHIAVLDSEIFLEKFICVSCAKYFR